MVGLAIAALAWMTFKSWKGTSPMKGGPVMPGLILKNIRYTKTSHGRAVWTLTAAQAEHEQDTGITSARNIKLIFHDKTRGDIVLTADQGRVFSSNDTIMISGHVRIENKPENILVTDKLYYDEKTGILSTDSPVQARLDNSTIKGRGLLIDTRQRILEIMSGVNATLDQQQPGSVKP